MMKEKALDQGCRCGTAAQRLHLCWGTDSFFSADSWHFEKAHVIDSTALWASWHGSGEDS
jgi:hypothetical protein